MSKSDLIALAKRGKDSWNAWIASAGDNTDADFSDCDIAGVQFSGFVFPRTANFRRSTFSDDVSFSDTTFKGGVSFEGATFKASTTFLRATFSSRADFSNVKFAGPNCIFGNAKFNGLARFSNAQFTTLGASLIVSTTNVALLFGSDKWPLRLEALRSLALESDNKLGMCVQVSNYAQSAIGLMLLFLVGLGLRNRFRISSGGNNG